MKTSKMMKNVNRIYSLLFLTLIPSIAPAQMNEHVCNDLRMHFTLLDTTAIPSNSWYHIKTKGNKQELNYVTPLRRIFLNQVKYAFNDVSWQNLTILLSMVGAQQDITNITQQYDKYEAKSNPPAKSDSLSDTFALVDFHLFLREVDTCKVIMINEAHDRIQPRAFILSILSQLKSKGFTHLAMETLNYSNLNIISLHTGYLTAEPMFGEVVREAFRLGFTLVPYEDTNAIKHTNAEREIAQATNLTNAIKAAPQSAKFFVIAGYAHIAEDIPGDIYNTMAMQFKKISGINPFTIDQITSLEDSNSFLFENISRGLTTSKAIVNVSDAISIGLAHYDAFIVHPPTKLVNCRPDWLTCNGMKKDFSVECNNKKAVLIQVYYKDEITSNQSYQTRVPADQTFYLDKDGFAHLFLIPGNNYVVVFRDENNKIIHTEKIKV